MATSSAALFPCRDYETLAVSEGCGGGCREFIYDIEAEATQPHLERLVPWVDVRGPCHPLHTESAREEVVGGFAALAGRPRRAQTRRRWEACAPMCFAAEAKCGVHAPRS